MLTRASKITKYVQVATLLGLALILFFWPFIDALAPALDATKIAGIVTAVIAGMVLYFDDRISQIIRGPEGIITHGTLAECMDEAFRGRRYISHLRIMATSSEVIEAMIGSRNVKIGRCDLLLRRYPDGSNSYNNRVDYAIAEWRELGSTGRIENLVIGRYETIPSEYIVIVDEKAMIMGSYQYQPTSASQAEFLSPTLVLAASSEARDMIKRRAEAFDANLAAWPREEGL
jgi:hypothetical protein